MEFLSTSAIISVGTLCCLVYVAIKAAIFMRKYRQRTAILNHFDHDPAHWFWGNLNDFPKRPDEHGLKWKRDRIAQYPDATTNWFGFLLPEVCLTSAKSVKPLLKSFEPKGFMYRFLTPWLGDGLLLSKGDKWARNRRLLTPAFHFEILKPYLQIKNRAADKLCSKIQKFAETGEYFEGCHMITMFTLDVILKCAFSYEINCQDIGDEHPYVKAIFELGNILTDRFLKPWLHPDFIFFRTALGKSFMKNCEKIHKIAEDIIAQRKRVLLENGQSDDGIKKRGKYTDFLDILLMASDENGVGLTDLEIRDEVNTFLFEGHDTTASAISWALFSLADNGEIQDRVQQEIDNLLVGRNSDDLEANDLQKLPYLSMCIKESLRLHSTVSYIQRQTEAPHNILGKLLPADIMTSIYIYCVHHNPQYWQESLVFKPERFTPENIEKMDPFAFIPFSAGPRNCIGQNFAMHEIKVALVKILSRYFLDVDPNHEVKKIECLVMRAETGIRFKATLRMSGQYRFQ
ncbi:hypothetical protein LOTGIDRAFT_211775 [Lottia gigantea]|uniref:Cytochrome P450 n=1 Tax=Lottia gigantea TaxID=225164 RepID=V4BBM5_LOTGI|nr:hypothetical protein LOTGIDRAFT_211775 [Lottia gigantea]ESP04976.1 hypothetical protein LOTGIDRAFT_211775 [Lottia gigantea]